MNIQCLLVRAFLLVVSMFVAMWQAVSALFSSLEGRDLRWWSAPSGSGGFR